MTNFFPMYYENDLGPWDNFNPRYLFSQPDAKSLMSRLICQGPVLPEDQVLLENLLAMGLVEKRTAGYQVTVPFFTNQDVPLLERVLFQRAEHLSRQIMQNLPCLSGKSPTERFLLLGDLVFDGLLFDWLATEKIVCDGYIYGGNRNYLINFYEDQGALADFSNRLLCSNNRVTAEGVSLASFGDSLGYRRDLFRWSMLRRTGKVTLYPQFQQLEQLVSKEWSPDKLTSFVIDGIKKIIQKTDPSSLQKEILFLLGYLDTNGHIVVPVLQQAEISPLCKDFIQQFGSTLQTDFIHFKNELADLSALRHGVDYWLVTNELWHCYFGMINQVLLENNYFSLASADETGGRYERFIQI